MSKSKLRIQLDAQVEHIAAIAAEDIPLNVKIILLEGQREYMIHFLDRMIDELKQPKGNDE